MKKSKRLGIIREILKCVDNGEFNSYIDLCDYALNIKKDDEWFDVLTNTKSCYVICEFLKSKFGHI